MHSRFTARYNHDLVGNRLSRTTDEGNGDPDAQPFVADETVTYAYDAQDRHTVYRYDADGDGVDDDTVQTHKTVHDGLSDAGPVIEQTAQQYDPQGRLAQVSTTKAGSTTVTDYTYDDDGYRLSRTVVTDGGTPVVTAYLPDTENPTGYTQTLERRVDGQLRRTYTLGQDVLAQAETVAQGALGPGEPVVFLHDGHGSTRALVHAVTAAVIQRFAYDAYGNHLLADGSGLTGAADAITDLLYSGEATDPTGRQYLRARWYDPTTGRFNRLDPFAGFAHEPQSLHKYLYAHADPIMGTDPSGEVLPLLIGVASFGFKAYAAYETGSNIFDLVHRIREGAAIRGLLIEMVADAALNFVGGKVLDRAIDGLHLVARKFRNKLDDVAVGYGYRDQYIQLNPGIPRDWHVHHAIPQRYREQFAKAGMDIDDPALLRGVHPKMHDLITEDWQEFHQQHGGAPSIEDIIDFAQEIEQEYSDAFY